MTVKNRLTAVILAVSVVFVMLFSVCFIAAEAGHDCIGDGCPVCCLISVCENTLRGIAFAAVFTAAVISCLYISVISVGAVISAHGTSLISLKVKLSD